MRDQRTQIESVRAHTSSDTTLNPGERERRENILHEILTRLQHEDDHVARAHPDRARQFMPFAALKGYHELAHERERVPEPKHAMTDERAAELSQIISHLSKGTMVSVVHYKQDHYVTTCGIITEIDEAFRTIHIVRDKISFNNILSVEPL